MLINGSQIVIECLIEQGVDTVFGYPGGCILNIYDEPYKNSNRITHILTAHEQGASHAADGYARSTGKVGVCFATSGPGATNLVTGIATAYLTAEATAQGLSTCILGWLDDKKIRAICGLEHPVRLVITLGYAKEETIRPKKRKDLSELVKDVH